ncbi:MAG: DUF4827 domain-containing protein [Bacteroidales bacterium]|nr:DUF4827 domain-containing protein [Bacteroidales bacterium]
MNRTLLFAGALALTLSYTSCSDTQTYADLVATEKEAISTWITVDPQGANFGNIISKDEDWLDDITEDVLEDDMHPEQCGLELGQWYRITEGDFKRLYFRINSWGNEGAEMDSLRANGITPTDEQYATAMQSKKKFNSTSNHDVLIRYDHMWMMTNYDYEDEDENIEYDNLDANSYVICYNWNPSYYASTYYSTYYSTGSSYECTSGGLAFPIRFLWEGGNASIICPFSLVESALSSYYYTLYYGEIEYTKSTYLPQ